MPFADLGKFLKVNFLIFLRRFTPFPIFHQILYQKKYVLYTRFIHYIITLALKSSYSLMVLYEFLKFCLFYIYSKEWTFFKIVYEIFFLIVKPPLYHSKMLLNLINFFLFRYVDYINIFKIIILVYYFIIIIYYFSSFHHKYIIFLVLLIFLNAHLI